MATTKIAARLSPEAGTAQAVPALVVLGNGIFRRDGSYRISRACRRLVAEAERSARRLDARIVVFTGWAPGEVVVDRHPIPIKPDAPKGSLQIEVGLYDAASGERLKLAGGADHVILGAIELK